MSGKLKTLALLALGLSGWSAAPALANSVVYDFSFTNGIVGVGGINGSGTLTATPNGDGSYTAIAGAGTVTSPSYNGAYTLIADPSAPNVINSPTGAFTYDDQLFPSQDPLIDNSGLLFAPANPPPTELNLFSVQFMPEIDQYYEDVFGFNGYVQFSLTPETQPVPFPAAAGLGFSMLSVFGALAVVRRRFSRSSRIA